MSNTEKLTLIIGQIAEAKELWDRLDDSILTMRNDQEAVLREMKNLEEQRDKLYASISEEAIRKIQIQRMFPVSAELGETVNA